MKFFSSSIQDEVPTVSNTEETKGFFGRIKGMISSNESNETQSPSGCKDKLLTLIEVEVSYTYFFIVLLIGAAILFLSLLFLPVAIINPKKFVSLFSLGSLVTITSFIFLYGTKEFFSKLFDSGRRILTILYLASIVIGLFFSFTDSYTIISHICAVFQLITLITFVLSFIPGGHLGISFIWGSIKSIFVKS